MSPPHALNASPCLSPAQPCFKYSARRHGRWNLRMHFVATLRSLSRSRDSDHPLHISGMDGYAVPIVAVQVNSVRPVAESPTMVTSKKADPKSTDPKSKPRTQLNPGDGKPIEQYTHKGKDRVNNPPVGLVTPETDKDVGKKKYSYDP